MVDNLLHNIFSLRLVRMFKLHTTPRWLILLIDTIIVLVSFMLTVILDVFIHKQVVSVAHLLGNAVIVLGVFVLVSYITKSYACVIRLSVIEDLNRMLLTVLMTAALLLLGNSASLLLFGSPYISWVNVLSIAVLSFSIMMVERLFIKYFYMKLTASGGRKRVLVLGTSVDSIVLADALKSEISGKYMPVGLLSMAERKEKNSEINGLPVYRFDEATTAQMFADNDIEALVFGETWVSEVRSKLADYFMSHGITLLSINKVQEFDAGETAEDTHGISSYVKEVQIEDLLGRDPIVLNNTLVNNQINGSVVLITGACGSIGSEIVRQVAAYNARTIVLVDQAETPMHDLHLELSRTYPDADVKLCIGDVQNHERMEEIFAKYRPQFVFHAAAYKHVPMMEINPTEAVLTNVMGTRIVADLALKYKALKFVMISTDKAVNPTNIMGCTKRLAEIYCQSLFHDAARRGLKTQYITTRFGNVLGSNGSVIPLFRRQIAAGGPVTVTHRDITRFFMTIPEACSLVLEAGCMGHGGEIYVFDMGESVKIYDLAVRMISLAGLKPGVDIEIKEIGLRPGEKLYEEVLNDKELTTATVNKKIMIAKVRTYDYTEVCNHLDIIIKAAHEARVHDMVMQMKLFVPEYKSNQSEFEAIDREIAENNPLAQQPQPETEKYY